MGNMENPDLLFREFRVQISKIVSEDEKEEKRKGG